MWAEPHKETTEADDIVESVELVAAGDDASIKTTDATDEELNELLDVELPISANVNLKADGNTVSVGTLG